MNSTDKKGVGALQPRTVTPRAHRPVFLDLRHIAMPVGALTSIGHRISGVVLTVAVPMAIYFFARSLEDQTGFASVTAVAAHPAFKVTAIFAAWALAHHLLGGVRHLLSDFEFGSPLRSARKTAWFVNVAGVAMALLAAAVVW
jgi:succinate dehydrogenase / fumarate reductase cytochrome b subunit